MAGLYFQQFALVGDGVGLRDGLALPNGEGFVLVGVGEEGRVEEHMAGHAADGRKHLEVLDSLLLQLVDQTAAQALVAVVIGKHTARYEAGSLIPSCTFGIVKRAPYILLLVGLDLLAAFVGYLLFYLVRKELLGELVVLDVAAFPKGGAIAGFWVVLYAFAGFYKEPFRKSRTRESGRLIGTSLVGAVILFFLVLLDDAGVQDYRLYYKTFGAFVGLHLLFGLLAKNIGLTIIKARLASGKIWFNTLMVGTSAHALEVYQDLERIRKEIGLRIIGCLRVEATGEHPLESQLRSLGGYENLPKWVRRARIEQVIIAARPEDHERLQHMIAILEGYDVRIFVVPDFYQILLGTARMNHLQGVPLIEVNLAFIPWRQRVIKRLFDLCFSVVFLTVFSPFLLLIGLITKLSSKGPVFYTQERIGRYEKPFRIIKFRSMKVSAEAMSGPALATDRDPRITPWGRIMRKTRLDELPQFVNVLFGQMSVVGPRPERQHFIELITEQAPHYRRLLKVRPGITSLGQVKFGYASNVEEMLRRVKFDVLYLENMSLAMDFRIILYTIRTVVQGRGK